MPDGNFNEIACMFLRTFVRSVARPRASIQCHFPFLALFRVHFWVHFWALFRVNFLKDFRSSDIFPFQKSFWGPFWAFLKMTLN